MGNILESILCVPTLQESVMVRWEHLFAVEGWLLVVTFLSVSVEKCITRARFGCITAVALGAESSAFRFFERTSIKLPVLQSCRLISGKS